MQRLGSFPLHCGFSCAFFLQRSERTPGRCNGLVRFRCIVDSVVRFLQRSERTPRNGLVRFPVLWIQLCVFCNAVNARQVGATAWFVSAALWIQLCVFFATQ